MREVPGSTPGQASRVFHYRAFSHDVTAAMLVFQNKEIVAIMVYQTNPPRIELFYAGHVNENNRNEKRRRHRKQNQQL